MSGCVGVSVCPALVLGGVLCSKANVLAQRLLPYGSATSTSRSNTHYCSDCLVVFVWICSTFVQEARPWHIRIHGQCSALIKPALWCGRLHEEPLRVSNSSNFGGSSKLLPGVCLHLYPALLAPVHARKSRVPSVSLRVGTTYDSYTLVSCLASNRIQAASHVEVKLTYPGAYSRRAVGKT